VVFRYPAVPGTPGPPIAPGTRAAGRRTIRAAFVSRALEYTPLESSPYCLVEQQHTSSNKAEREMLSPAWLPSYPEAWAVDLVLVGIFTWDTKPESPNVRQPPYFLRATPPY
jgi:hypothetical protein